MSLPSWLVDLVAYVPQDIPTYTMCLSTYILTCLVVCLKVCYGLSVREIGDDSYQLESSAYKDYNLYTDWKAAS